MTLITDAIYLVSSLLLIPVMLTLLIFMLWSLFSLGSFSREYLERRSGLKNWKKFSVDLQILKLSKTGTKLQMKNASDFFKTHKYPGLLGLFAKRGEIIHQDFDCLERLVCEIEIIASESLSKMSLGIRIAPMLGLMGTLIPMGPALIGLSNGDIKTLSANLVIAFGTTVIGLFVGSLCYLMSLARRRWYARDLADIEYIFQNLTHKIEGQENNEEEKIFGEEKALASLSVSS